jgi:hypothetical protein
MNDPLMRQSPTHPTNISALSRKFMMFPLEPGQATPPAVDVSWPA